MPPEEAREVTGHVAAVDCLEYSGSVDWDLNGWARYTVGGFKYLETWDWWWGETKRDLAHSVNQVDRADQPPAMWGRARLAHKTAKDTGIPMPLGVAGLPGAVYATGKGVRINQGFVSLPIALTYKGCTIALNPDVERGGRETPNFYVTIPGAACLMHGAKTLWLEIRRVVEALGGRMEAASEWIRRGDVCLDLIGMSNRRWAIAVIDQRVKSRAKETIPQYAGRAKLTGFRVGSGERVLLRCYDKVQELEDKGDEVYKAAWVQRRAGGAMPEEATRIEYQMRREWLRENGVDTVADFFAKLAAIVAELTRVRDPFFQITERENDAEKQRTHKSQKRLGIDAAWEWACQVFRDLAGEIKDRLEKLKRGTISAKQAAQQVVGCLISAGVQMGFQGGRPEDLAAVLEQLCDRNLITNELIREKWKLKAELAGLVPI